MAMMRGLWRALAIAGPAALLILGPAAVLSVDARPWDRGVVLAGVLTATLIGWNIALATRRPESFAGRARPYVEGAARKQPLIDAVGSVAYLIFVLAWLAFIPLDVFRLRLLPPPPAWAAGVGLAAAVAGPTVAFLAVWQNAFATPAIADQSDRGQRIIDTGVYGVIRHPLYAGNLLLFAGAALWLGSVAAALATVVHLVATLARIGIEEDFLRQRFPDYADYARRVRGRLIPFVL
jgi:protein-S-isoprenylcysteine O-methyltransferase Ste14